MTPADLAVLIPASNEEALIGPCLAALAASDPVLRGGEPARVQVTVIANGCRDRTAEVARQAGAALTARGWQVTVLDLAQGGKTLALAAGEGASPAAVTAYLDADVTVSPALLAQTMAVLDRPDPAYASGRVKITARGRISKLYARFWQQVPFMREGVAGCGYFAMNAAGRARFGDWPQIISDDTFVRLQFTPAERLPLAASFDWPIAEGADALVKVRRRQNRGVDQIAQQFGHLLANNDPPAPAGTIRRLALADPVGFAVYAGVALAVKLRRANDDWVRSR